MLLGFRSKKLKNMSLGVDQQLRVVIQKGQVKCYLVFILRARLQVESKKIK